MPELAADFTINNISPIEFEAEISPSEHFDCSFEVHVTPDISHLATKQELEDAVDTINARIDDVEAEVETKVETITGSDLIDVQRTDNEVTITSKTYIHEQGVASDTWTINHNLNKYPSVTLIDTAGTIFIGRVEYTDTNNCIVTINGSTKGKALLN